MNKKPTLIVSKEKKLKASKKKFVSETTESGNAETKQTTIILEADLLYAAKEVALKRKRSGVEPNTITGMLRQALKEIVDKELSK